MKPSPRALRWLAGGALVALIATFSWSTEHNSKTDSAPSAFAARPSLESRVRANNRPMASSLKTVDAAGAEVRAKLARWHQVTTGDTETQEQLTAELSALLTDDNAAGIAQSLSAEQLDTPFGLAALARWLTVDATTAGAWIASRTDATEAQALLVVRALLNEPGRFREFCDGLPDTEWKQTLLRAAGLACVAQDPAGAIDIAWRMAPGSAQTNVLQTAAFDWMTRDPLAAAAWIVKVDDATLREQLLAVGTKALASTDPDLAAGWLAEIKSDGVRHDTALCLVETWVARDPVAAADWVTRISAPELRAAAVELVAQHWLQSDPSAATAWLEKLPERDAVLASLKAEHAGVDDPADSQ
jgi:hypothetical protein